MTASLEQLFAAFAMSGDPAPLGEVFDRSNAQLLSLALHLCGEPALAEDALQATFLTAIAKRAEWDPSRPLLPWLTGILVLHCRQLRERRGRRREVALEDRPDEGAVDVVAEQSRRELIEQLRRHAEALPGEQRAVVLLQLEHGLRPAQIAEVLDVAPGTVRMRLARALKALRGRMPSALLALVGVALAPRGVAAVRAQVMQQAGATAPLVTVATGALLMKKLSVVAVVLLSSLLAWQWWPVVEPMPQSPAGHGAPALVTGGTAGDVAASVVTAERAQPLATTSGQATDETDTAGIEVRIVEHSTDRPLPNVPVHVRPVRADCDPELDVLHALSDARGVCSFACGSGRFLVGTIGGGEREAVEVEAEQPVRVELRLPLQEQPWAHAAVVQSVRGRVVTAAGEAVPGAEILISSTAASIALPAAVADAAGAFELDVLPSWVLVGACAAGAAPSDLMACVPGRELVLVLPGASASVAGVVVAADDTPISAALVRVGRPYGAGQWVDTHGVMHESPRAQLVTTDGEGRFFVDGLRRGQLQLEVYADDHAPLERIVDTVGGDVGDLTLRLGSGLQLRGRVVDQVGASVAGARVQLAGTYGETRVTMADGRFAFRSVPSVRMQLHVEIPEGPPVHVERDLVAEPGEWQVTVTRWPAYVLRLVDDTGAPLVGWGLRSAEADSPRATDTDGLVVLRIDAAGGGALLATAPGAVRLPVPCALPTGALPGVEATIVIPRAALPTATITAAVRAADGTVPEGAVVTVLDGEGHNVSWQRVVGGAVETGALPPGDYVLEVHRAGRGGCGGRFAVTGLRVGERRDAGTLRLPAEGTMSLHVVHADGSAPRSAAVFLFDVDGREHRAPPADGAPHPWPIGRYDYLVMEDASLWQRGSVEVRAGEPTAIDVVLRPAVRRKLAFPVPTPAWGAPERVDFVLRAPDGSVYDRGDFDPREELPYRYCPPLGVGAWRVELLLDDGRRFVGAFVVEDLSPVLEELRLPVEPAR